MAQKWYKKASVQAALAGGAFIIIGSIITGVFTILSPDTPSDKSIVENSKIIEIGDDNKDINISIGNNNRLYR